MATTFKLFSDKMGGRDATAYIGTPGEMFYDSTTGGLRVSDGTTAGGKPIELSTVSLTGNIDANVNLRSGTLASLLPLAGGASEIGYATDVNAVVKFNGVAGGAEVLTGGATKYYTYNSFNQNTVIDCTNVSCLILNVTGFIVYNFPQFINIRIKFPDSRKISNFTIIKTGTGQIGQDQYGIGELKITPSFQTGDPKGNYGAITADLVSTTNVYPYIPYFSVSGFDAFKVEFLTTETYWTRYPLPWELTSTSNSINLRTTVGTNNYGAYQDPGIALTSGILTQLGDSTALTSGGYIVSWTVEYTSTNATALNANDVMAWVWFNNTTTPTFADRSIMQITSLANTKTVSLSGVQFITGGSDYFLTTKATITSGTVSAKAVLKYMRIS